MRMFAALLAVMVVLMGGCRTNVRSGSRMAEEVGVCFAE